MDTNDVPLTDKEQAALKAAGYESRGGGNVNGDGVVWLRFRRGDTTITATRAEWRSIIASLNKPSTEDESADLTVQLIASMAAEVQATDRMDLETVAEEAATATGLRRAVWAALTEEERAAAIKAAVERGMKERDHEC